MKMYEVEVQSIDPETIEITQDDEVRGPSVIVISVEQAEVLCRFIMAAKRESVGQ